MYWKSDMVNACLSVDHFSHINSAVSRHTYIVSNVHYRILFRPHAQSSRSLKLDFEHVVAFLRCSWEESPTLYGRRLFSLCVLIYILHPFQLLHVVRHLFVRTPSDPSHLCCIPTDNGYKVYTLWTAVRFSHTARYLLFAHDKTMECWILLTDSR